MELITTKMLSAAIEVNGKQYILEPNNICHVGSQPPELPNDILIEHQSIKDTHATITNFDRNWFIISRTGKDTYVNGVEITRCPFKLEQQDIIKFGEVEAQFNLKNINEVTNESSGYEDVISSSPELLQKRHLLFKNNEREEVCEKIIDTTCDDSFIINATQNNVEINKENDEMCFIPETQALPNYIDKNIAEGFGEDMDIEESQFVLDSEGFHDGENVFNGSMNEELTSLVIPYVQHDTVMLFDENVLNSVNENSSDISKNCGDKKSEMDKLDLSTLNKNPEIDDEERSVDERDGSCTPDLFDQVYACEISRKKESKKPNTPIKESDSTISVPSVNDSRLLATQKFEVATLDEDGLPSNISQNENKTPKNATAKYSGLEATQIFLEPNLETLQNIHESQLETPQFFKQKYIKPKQLPKIEILNKSEIINNNTSDIDHDKWLEEVNRQVNRKTVQFDELLNYSKTDTAAKKDAWNSSKATEKKFCAGTESKIDTKEENLSKNLKSETSESETSSYNKIDQITPISSKNLKRNSDDSLESGGKKRRLSNTSQLKKNSSPKQNDASKLLSKTGKTLNCKVKLKKTIIQTKNTLDTSKAKHNKDKKTSLISQEEIAIPAKTKPVKEDDETATTKNYKSYDLKKSKVSTDITDKNASKSNEAEILHLNKKKQTTPETKESKVIEKKSKRIKLNNSKTDETKQKSIKTSTPIVEKRRETRLASEVEAQVSNAKALKKLKKESPEKHTVKEEITSKPITEKIPYTDKRNTRHSASKTNDKSRQKTSKEASGSKVDTANVTKTQLKTLVSEEEVVMPRRTTRLMSFKPTENKEEDVKKKTKQTERRASTSENKEVSKEHKEENSPILVSFSTIDLNDIQYLKHKSNNLWDEADHAKNCDVLIMNKASRTIKFLIAIARGIPIVTLDWLSKKSANSKDLSNCMLKDKEFERKYNFKLVNALSKSHKMKLFKGFEFSMTENISPGTTDMRDLLSCTGAIVHTKLSSHTKSTKKNIKGSYLISSEKDKTMWEQHTKHDSSVHVVSTEGVMLAVMHQDVAYLDKHILT